MSTEFWETRKQRTATLIELYENAIEFLSSNPTKSYNLDTGQSTQEVTRFDLPNLEQSLSRVENKYAVLCQRTRTTPTISTPAW